VKYRAIAVTALIAILFLAACGSQAIYNSKTAKHIMLFAFILFLSACTDNIAMQEADDPPTVEGRYAVKDDAQQVEDDNEQQIIDSFNAQQATFVSHMNIQIQGGQANWATAEHEMFNLQFDDFNFDGYLTK